MRKLFAMVMVLWLLATLLPRNFSMASVQTSQEEIVTRMHEKSLTRYDTVSDFMRENPFTREQATRFFGELAGNVYQKQADLSIECSFSDIGEADPTLVQFIIQSCQLGLFQWSQGKFMPKDKLTNAQAVTVMVRLLEGKKLDETMDPRYQNYYAVAMQKGFLQWLQLANIWQANADSTRGEVGSMMYQAYFLWDDSWESEETTTPDANNDETDSTNSDDSSNEQEESTWEQDVPSDEEQGEWQEDSTTETSTPTEKYTTYIDATGNELYNILYDESCLVDKWLSSDRLDRGSCDKDLDQKFVVMPYWDETFKIYNENTQSCLISQNWPKEESEIIYGECNDTYNSQKRYIEYETPWTRISRIKMKWTELCIEVYSSFGYGQLKPCDSEEASQYFVFNKVAGTPYNDSWDQQQDDLSCNSDEHEEDNTCVNNTKSCTISNWNGEQTWNGSSWGSCEAISCNSGYTKSWDTCVQQEVNCTEKEIKDNGVCYDHFKNYSISNGKGLEVYTAGDGYEKYLYCDIGYELQWESCVAITEPSCDAGNFSFEITNGYTCVPDNITLSNCSIDNGIGGMLSEGWENIVSCIDALSSADNWAIGVCSWPTVWSCKAMSCNKWYELMDNSCSQKRKSGCERFEIGESCNDPVGRGA